MRIFLVHNQYQQAGGEDQAVQNEMAMLQRKGHSVYAFLKTNDALNTVTEKITTALQTSFRKASHDELLAALRKERPEIVHVHNFFPRITPAVFTASAELGIPTVLTLHNYRLFCANALLLRGGKPCELCLTGSAWQGVLHGCYRGSRLATIPVARMIRTHQKRGTWKTLVSRFIALSNFSRSKFVAAGLPAERIDIKPNFAFARPTARSAAAEVPRFLCVARLSDEKGIRTLIRAWDSLPYELQLVGDGPLREWVEANRSPRVSILGRRTTDEITRMMQKASALILPSECYENFPLVVAEAYASGLPVLGSRIGALGEIILPGRTGEHFRPNDKESLRQTVTQFIEKTAEVSVRESYHRHSLAKYNELYSEESNYRTLEAIYQSAISLPVPGPRRGVNRLFI